MAKRYNLPSTATRYPGERYSCWFVAVCGPLRQVHTRLSEVFGGPRGMADAMAALARAKHAEPKAELVEEVVQRFVHGID